MGIFSFGKKDDAPTRRGANTSSNRAARGERVERRTRRTERAVEADAMLLDPTLPEKQRARRRLVGAIALVVAAVIVLPMVLDSHPKPVTDDISIDIPSRPAPKVAKADVDTQGGVAPDNPTTADAGLAASGLAPATSTSTSTKPSQQAATPSASPSATPTPSHSQQTANTAPTTNTGKPSAKSLAPSVAANTAPVAPKTSAAQRSATTTAANTASADDDSTTSSAAKANATTGTPASPPGSRFEVQLGAFANDANARNLAAKLKAAGVPAYTEHRKQPDGSTLTLLRAGPFADRAAASAAVAKVRAIGLSSGTSAGSGNGGGSSSSNAAQ
ncbi:SPOR domain-containing protein [Paraburkholderia sp. BCC1886]|uniref:SPOR domain-containing protein n=1 Tax=Paraburkholderia sp. BCC1886 TaxID=2562670 RepID=UPI001182A90D|nr:SPOR domain-containing protein [Paraburkholderia sp. BCC1886]